MDFNKLSKKQFEVLGQISIGNDGGHHPRTIESLLNLGLIEEYNEELKDRLGKFIIKRYFMPIHVHVHWCQWCSEHYKEENGLQ